MLCGAVAACATPSIITRSISSDNSALAFRFCGGAGCGYPKTIRFTQGEWAQIVAPLEAPASSSSEEREGLAAVVGRFETVAGAKTGAATDLGGTLFNGSGAGQLDCFSEASNTSNLLGLLQRRGVLLFHRVEEPAMRGFLFGTPAFAAHSTAVVREKETGEPYAIDSWFFDNGHEAAVVELGRWKWGWSPDGAATF
ncbi:MAG: hypothetical protein ACKVRO_06585 [Micropepsaceae bacterium]